MLMHTSVHDCRCRSAVASLVTLASASSPLKTSMASTVALVALAVLGLLLEPLELAGLGGSWPLQGCCAVRGLRLEHRAQVGVHLG